MEVVMEKLTKEILEGLRKQARERPLFSAEFSDQEFVFTTITRSQYAELEDWIRRSQNVPTSEIDEQIVERGLLWPNLDPIQRSMLTAGVIPSLSRMIQEKSYLSVDGDVTNVAAILLKDYEREEDVQEEAIAELKAVATYPMKAVNMCGKSFVVRPIFRGELSGIRRRGETDPSMDVDSEIAKLCTLYPKGLDVEHLPAGVASVLSQQVLLLSGFGENMVTVKAL